MKFNITKILRGLSKIVLVLAGVFLLGLLSYTVYLSVKYKPMKVRVTNITGSSATVSWVTDTPMPGIVYYKEKDSFLPGPLAWIGSRKAWDDRDVSYAETKCVEDFNNSVDVSADFSVDMNDYDCNDVKVKKADKYYTHHVTLKNLDEQKDYFFRVGDGLLGWDVDVNNVKTYLLPKEIKEPMPVFGRIGNTDGDYSNDSIIYVQFKDGSESVASGWVSGVTNDDGGWYVDASIATDSNGNKIDLELSQDVFIANAQFQNYNLSDDNEWILGYFNGAYPDILVEKEIQAGIFNSFVFNSYAECGYRTLSDCGEDELIAHKSDWGYGNVTKALAAKTNGGNINEEVLNKLGLGGDPVKIAGNLQVITGKSITANDVKKIQGNGEKVEAKKTNNGWSVGSENKKVTINSPKDNKAVAINIGSIINDGKEITFKVGQSEYSKEILIKYLGREGDKKLVDILSDNKCGDSCNIEVFTYTIEFDEILRTIQSQLEDANDRMEPKMSQLEKMYERSTPQLVKAKENIKNNSEEVIEIIRKNYPADAIKNGEVFPGFSWQNKVDVYDGPVSPITVNTDIYTLNGDGLTSEILSAYLNSESVSYAEKMKFLKSTNEFGNNDRKPLFGGVYSIDSAGNLYWDCDPIWCNDRVKILSKGELENFNLDIKEDTFVAIQEELNKGKVTNNIVEKISIEEVVDDIEEGIPWLDADGSLDKYRNCFEKSGCDSETAKSAMSAIESYPYADDNYGFIQLDGNKVRIGKDPGYDYWKTKLENLNNQGRSLQEINNLFYTINRQSSSNSNIFEPSKTYAQETESNNYAMYLPEYGMFSMQLGDFEFDKETSNGNTIFLFYIETNGIDGLQLPQDPENPGPNDDMVMKSDAYEISYSKESTVKTLDIKKGVNLVSFDFMTVSENDNNYSASDIILEGAKRGVDIEYVTYFDGGRWMNGYRCDDDGCQGTDFDILPGKGYLVYSGSDGKIYVPAYDLLSSIPVAFSQGWNLVGIHGYSKKYTARTLIDSINSIEGLKANNVSWWPTSKSKYEGLQVEDNQEYGLDFPISSTNGYFVRINEFKPESSDCKSIIWHDGGELNGSCGNSKTIF